MVEVLDGTDEPHPEEIAPDYGVLFFLLALSFTASVIVSVLPWFVARLR